LLNENIINNYKLLKKSLLWLTSILCFYKININLIPKSDIVSKKVGWWSGSGGKAAAS
jgi:hypothetical protein